MSDTSVYGETFSPVVQLQTVRVVLAVAAQLNLEIVMMDLPKAFLLGKLDDSRPINMYAPDGGYGLPGNYGCSYFRFMALQFPLASSLKHFLNLFALLASLTSVVMMPVYSNATAAYLWLVNFRDLHLPLKL